MTLLVTVACRSSPARLAPAQGCQDHTTSPSANRAARPACAFSVHRIPPHVRDDAYAPLVEAGRAYDKQKILKSESNIFFARGLDRFSQNSLVGQISWAK